MTEVNWFLRYKSYLDKGEEEVKKKISLTKGGILSHSNYSKGAKALAEALGLPKVWRMSLGQTVQLDPGLFTATADGYYGTSKYVVKPDASIPFLINWGCADPKKGSLEKEFLVPVKRIFNNPKAVTTAANKTAFFTLMSKAKDAPRIPEFTTSLEEAQKWVDGGAEVIGRLNHGHSGTDVAFYKENPDKFLGAELWVQYKKKKHEYRLHFMNGGVTLVQQKVLPKQDPEGNAIPKDNVDFRIRTHRTGFIFQRNNLTIPTDVTTQALKAAAASGLDFGAIDVIYNQHENKAYVLEINTAPGLEGSTVDVYKEQFQQLLAA